MHKQAISWITESGFWTPIKIETWFWTIGLVRRLYHLNPGLNPINKIPSSEKFSDKNLRILNPQIFSEILRNSQTKYFGAAGWTDFWKFSSEYFDRNTFWKSEEIVRILRILSEFWEFFVDRIEPWDPNQ